MKFKELDEFEFSSLHGKIDKIHFYKYSKYNLKDTLQSIVYYNKNRKAIKQIDFYGKDSITTISKYDSKNRLIKEVSNDKKTSTNKFYYNKKGNLIKKQEIQNEEINLESIYTYQKNETNINHYNKNELYSQTKLNYDNESNLTQLILVKKNISDTTKYINNYKKRTQITTNKNSLFYNKNKYNSNGIMISSQSCFNEKDTVFLTFEYDKKINLLKRTSYINGKLNFKDTRKNKYDKKGNLIERTIYSDGEFISRETFVIDYK